MALSMSLYDQSVRLRGSAILSYHARAPHSDGIAILDSGRHPRQIAAPFIEGRMED